MIDAATQKPVTVSTVNPTFPSIRVSVQQLPAVERALRDKGIRFQTDDGALTVNGGPEMTFVRLGRGGNAGAAQAALDGNH